VPTLFLRNIQNASSYGKNCRCGSAAIFHSNSNRPLSIGKSLRRLRYVSSFFDNNYERSMRYVEFSYPVQNKHATFRSSVNATSVSTRLYFWPVQIFPPRDKRKRYKRLRASDFTFTFLFAGRDINLHSITQEASVRKLYRIMYIFK